MHNIEVLVKLTNSVLVLFGGSEKSITATTWAGIQFREDKFHRGYKEIVLIQVILIEARGSNMEA